MTAALLRYARWQLRDHLMGAGRIVLLAALVIGIMLWRLRVADPNAAAGGPAALAAIIRSLSWPLILLATSGIVSGDRVDGYNRALFSAPISPTWYYLQRWLIGGLVVGTLPLCLAVALYFALGQWIDPWPYTAAHLLLYLLLGGLVFFWSAFGRRDWAVGLSVYFVQQSLQGAQAQNMPLPELFYMLNRLLPPFHLVEYGTATAPGVTLPVGAQWVHSIGYGVALLVAGAAILRLRPMGSGVRG